MAQKLNIDLEHTAVLAMDFHPGLVEMAMTKDPKFVERTLAVLDAARSAGVPVIYVIVRFREGYPEISPRNRTFLPIKERGGFMETGPAAVHPAVAPQPGDVICEKKRISAFAGSDLEMVLRGQGRTTLILMGIVTSGVVLSTTTEAGDRDYELLIVRDGCADFDDEVHRVLLDKVLTRQAAIVQSEDVVETLRK